MKKIILLNKLEDYIDRIQTAAPGWQVVQAGEKTGLDELATAEILVGWNSGVEKLCKENPGALKWVQVWSAGVDTLPLALLEQRKIALTSANGVHANSISETVFAMMLALGRGVLVAHANQLQGIWDQAVAWKGQQEIHGKTMGILGAGAIGQETARLAKAFGMQVLGMRRTKRETPYLDAVYTPAELDEMLGKCDFIVNILPATPETKGMLDDVRFAAVRPGARYINVGRGSTTDTDALVRALRDGRVAAAGLDVTDPEPLPSDSPLWKMPNVLVMPHVAGGTPYYDERAMEIFLENLQAYVQGKPLPRNLVDYARSY